MNLNSMCDDIEEGEIVSSSSDSDVPTKPICVKRKSLPLRYVVEKNTKLHGKHKRKCKHRHVKKAKLKMSPVKTKDHKKQKICSKQNLNSNSVNKISPKKSPSNVKKQEMYSNSLFSEISSTLKTSKDCDKKANKSVLHTAIPNCSSLNMIDCPKLPNGYNKCFNELKKNVSSEGNISNISLKTSAQSPARVSSNELVNESKKLEKVSSVTNFSPLSGESERKAEESEDEDELRRIALATFAKKSLSQNKIEKEVRSVDAVHIPLIDVQPVKDNYEVVDMELDDNIAPAADTADDLFVIDTKPALNNIDNDSPVDNDSRVEAKTLKDLPDTPADQEFEEEFLRAMLLAKLGSQPKKDHDDAVGEKEVLKDEKKIVKCVSKPKPINNLPLPSRKTEPVTLPTKKINTKVRCPPKTQPDNAIHMPQNRIVISLADESSSEESDAEVENNGPIAAPSASSLEALISSARMKSDQSKTGVENTDVSCLSKAQQEQYNLYKKILNASEGEQVLVNKNDISHLNNCQLKLKEKKLSIALSNYMKEKNLMANEKKECLLKRAAFLKMKLKAQRLKEELMETREMMKTNSQLYQKSINHFKILKKSVMKREELISNLKAECTKLGVSIKGENYVLPAVSDQTPSLVDKTNS